MSKQNDLPCDPAAILRSLGITEVREIAAVSGGWDTLLWRIETTGHRYALRVFRATQARTARREVAAMGAAAAANCPVPAIHAEGTWEDRPFLLLDWCPGHPLADVLVLQPWRAWWLGRACGGTQAQVHQINAPPAFQTDDWINWAGPLAETLRPKLERLDLQANRLIHLDYHPRNILIQEGKVSAILDWANAGAGDPRADLARSIAILRLAPRPGPAILSPLVIVILRLLEAGWRRGYVEQAGPTGPLAPFYTWAGAATVRDLAPKVGQPGIPLSKSDLERMERWTDEWARRAGINR